MPQKAGYVTDWSHMICKMGYKWVAYESHIGSTFEYNVSQLPSPNSAICDPVTTTLPIGY